MTVIIGVDPHKQSHTAVAICGEEREVAKVTVRATRQQADKLLAWAEPFKERTWAIESAGGLGYLLAQQLVDVGEHVVDVPPTLASRVRVLGHWSFGEERSRMMHSPAAVAALRFRAPSGRSGRAQRDHAAAGQAQPRPGPDAGPADLPTPQRSGGPLTRGIAKELYVSDADRLLESFEPATPIEHMRYELALELVDDIRRLDQQINESHRMHTAVRASNPSHQRLPCRPDRRLCADRLHGRCPSPRQPGPLRRLCAVAPIEHSSGGRVTHWLSRLGIKSSTTPSTSRPSDPSAAFRWLGLLRAQGRRGKGQDAKRFAPSSARSPTRSIASSSSTPKEGPAGHQRTTHCLRDRLRTVNGRLFGEVAPGPIQAYVPVSSRAGSVSRSRKVLKLGP